MSWAAACHVHLILGELWQHSLVSKEKSALFGVKGKKAEEDENSCSFQKMPVGNPHVTGSVCSGVHGVDASQAALFWEPRLLGALEKGYEQAERTRGCKSRVRWRVFAKTDSICFVICYFCCCWWWCFFITIIFYFWALLFSISVNSLILYIWFSFTQQMDLQTLLELKTRGELPGVFCPAPLAHNAIFHWRATVKKACTTHICYYLKYFTCFEHFLSYDSEQSGQKQTSQCLCI